MILISKQHAEHPFAGQNTQYIVIPLNQGFWFEKIHTVLFSFPSKAHTLLEKLLHTKLQLSKFEITSFNVLQAEILRQPPKLKANPIDS